MSLLVTAPWTAKYDDPISVAAGEPVEIGRSDDEYPGWAWCTDPRGKEGWMPLAFLDATASPPVALRDYDARELTVVPGDRLTPLEEHAGWIRCSVGDRTGWVPASAAQDAELVDLCDAWLAAWTGDRPDHLLSFFAPDAVYRDPATRGPLTGHAALGPYFRKLLARNPDWRWTRRELIPTAAGFTLNWRAAIPVGDTLIEEDGLDIVELRAGLITPNEVYFDRVALLRAMSAR